MNLWTSESIELCADLVIQVRATDDGVTIGKHVDGVDASDTLFTPEQAMQLADYLTQGAAKCLAMRGSK